MEYFVVMNGERTGPLGDSAIAQMIAAKKITGETLAWRDGLQNWQAASTIPELAPSLGDGIGTQRQSQVNRCCGAGGNRWCRGYVAI